MVEAFSYLIRELRAEYGYRQSDLAEAIGGERRTEQVISGLGGKFGADLTAALDFANSCQAGPIMVFL